MPLNLRLQGSSPVFGGQCHLIHLTILRRFSCPSFAYYVHKSDVKHHSFLHCHSTITRRYHQETNNCLKSRVCWEYLIQKRHLVALISNSICAVISVPHLTSTVTLSLDQVFMNIEQRRARLTVMDLTKIHLWRILLQRPLNLHTRRQCHLNADSTSASYIQHRKDVPLTRKATMRDISK